MYEVVRRPILLALLIAACAAPAHGAGVHARAATGVPPQLGGAWEAPFDFKGFAIHMAVLPTGKVLYWGYDEKQPDGSRPENKGIVWLWDPATGAFRNVNPPPIEPGGPPAPVYCSAQSFLPDGRLLLSGGNARWPRLKDDWVGTRFAWIFDPWKAERGEDPWERQADMREGRWYPSSVALADGRTLVAAGYNSDDRGRYDNPFLEIFDPSVQVDPARTAEENTRAQWNYAGARSHMALYPHLFVLADAQVLVAGPGRGDSALFDPVREVFTKEMFPELYPAGKVRHNRVGSTAVLLPGKASGSSTVMHLGGYPLGGSDSANGHPEGTAVSTAETLDGATKGEGWRLSPHHLNVARAYHNTVQLPDGSMVTVGGGKGESAQPGVGTYWQHPDGASRAVELWDPATGDWRLGAVQAEDRTYHSTAVLLPDGRVLSAGDDLHDSPGNPAWIDSAEIYSPPYLFGPDGTRLPEDARPSIATAPVAIRPGTTFGVRAGDGATPKNAVLIAPAATTHGADMHQRTVPLALERRQGDLLVLATPPSTAVAPPGPYMLFLVGEAGTPSVARWIRVDPKAPDTAVAEPAGRVGDTPAPLSPTGPAGPPGDGPRAAKDTRKPLLRATLVRRRKGVAVRLRASEWVKATVELKRGRTILASLGTTVSTKNRTLALRLTRAGRRALESRAKATLRVRATDAAGNRASLALARRLP